MPHKCCADHLFFLFTKLRQCVLCIILSTCLQPSALAIEVIINSANSKELLQGHHNLRSIYSMRTRYWTNGEKIRVFVLPDNHPLHKTFVKQKLLMFPHQLRSTWDRTTYTGTGQPPITVNSVTEMLEKIKYTKYSIGYIDRRVIEDEIHFLNAQ